jgi:hypothetical protein
MPTNPSRHFQPSSEITELHVAPIRLSASFTNSHLTKHEEKEERTVEDKVNGKSSKK